MVKVVQQLSLAYRPSPFRARFNYARASNAFRMRIIKTRTGQGGPGTEVEASNNYSHSSQKWVGPPS